MTWNDITVEQYQAIIKLQESKLDDFDKVSELIALLYNMTAHEVDELPISKYNELARSIMFIFEPIPVSKPKRVIKANGKRYAINYDASAMNQRQFSEVSYFNNNDAVGNMHNLLASICQPVKWGFKHKNNPKEHSSYAHDLKQAKITDVNDACVFFCTIYSSYLVVIEDYFNKLQHHQVAQMMKSLREFMDGSITLWRLPKSSESV